MLATDYIDSRAESGYVPALLNAGAKHGNKIIPLHISATLAKYLYLTMTGVYYVGAVRSRDGKQLYGVIEIYADDIESMRTED